MRQRGNERVFACDDVKETRRGEGGYARRGGSGRTRQGVLGEREREREREREQEA